METVYDCLTLSSPEGSAIVRDASYIDEVLPLRNLREAGLRRGEYIMYSGPELISACWSLRLRRNTDANAPGVFSRALVAQVTDCTPDTITIRYTYDDDTDTIELDTPARFARIAEWHHVIDGICVVPFRMLEFDKDDMETSGYMFDLARCMCPRNCPNASHLWGVTVSTYVTLDTGVLVETEGHKGNPGGGRGEYFLVTDIEHWMGSRSRQSPSKVVYACMHRLRCASPEMWAQKGYPVYMEEPHELRPMTERELGRFEFMDGLGDWSSGF